MPKSFIEGITKKLFGYFSKHSRLLREEPLVLVFVGVNQARKLNKTFRKKDYATDVLSFEGELVFCVPLIQKQAREHKLSFQQELGYLLIHGFLHLLGYDHEKSKREEKRMMNLQDKLFEKWCLAPKKRK